MALRPEIRLADVPALGLAVAGLGGVALALFAGGVVGLPLTVGVSVAAVLCLLFASSRRLAALMVYVVFAVVVGQRGSSELARTERASLLTFSNDTAIVVCRGTVVWYDEPMASGRSVNFWLADVQLRSDSQSVDLRTLRVRLSVPITAAATVNIGDVVAGFVRVESLNAPVSSFSDLCWSLRERLGARARLADEQSLVVVEGGWSARRALHDARSGLLGTFDRHLRPDARAVAGALLLGERNAFSAEFRDDLQVTGLAHLFALSGLNTGLLVSLCWLLLSWLRVPQRTRYILLLCLLAIYAALGLGVPSLIRSSIMAGMMITARLLHRQAHPLNLLLFAAGVELMVWPLHVLDAGFHLSYLSLAGILMSYTVLKQPLQDLLRTPRRGFGAHTTEILSATVGAQIATAPIAALLFGRVPGVAIVTNLVAIPLFSFLLVLVLLLLAFDPISLSVASAIGRTVEGLVGIFIAVTGWTATLIGASFVVPQQLWSATVALLLQLAAVAVAAAGRIRLAMMLVLLGLNITLWSPRLSERSAAEVAQIGSESSGLLLVRVGDCNGVIGCGSEWSESQSASALRSEFARQHLSRSDFLIIPSRAATMIGGAPTVIQLAQPELAIDVSAPRLTLTSARLDAVLHEQGVPLHRAIPGERWQIGAVLLEVQNLRSAGDAWEISLMAPDSTSVIVTNLSAAMERLSPASADSSVGTIVIAWPIKDAQGTRWVQTGKGWKQVLSGGMRAAEMWAIPTDRYV
ncbi:MAG: ComEC/Rec2 family competence protein [bacterium]|nr:ComEC/Rec2 family competence protein [bacterium]